MKATKKPSVQNFEIANLEEFHSFVRNEILPKVKHHTLFLLTGEMGAGKTELIKTLAGLLQMQDAQSPTFAFHHCYKGPHSLSLHHVDLYRLKGEDDLESTGFWDLFEDEDAAIFVEWANLVQGEAWPWGWHPLHIHIEKTGEISRKITLQS